MNIYFNPSVIIQDHFDEIKIQIDIKTETLLNDEIKKPCISQEVISEINDFRGMQVKKIDEIKQKNLDNFRNFNENEYLNRWKNLIANDLLDIKQKYEIMKEEIILFDCVLLEQPKFPNGIDLWITSWFNNPDILTFLK